MNSLRPKYGWYVLCWTGLWILLTVATQLPECYQRSNALDAGTPSAIDRDLAEFAMWRVLYEVPFGVLWGSLSWWLYSRRFDVQRHFARRIVSATVSVALLQGIIFGVPLAYLYTLFANFGMGNDDVPSVTINDRSIAIEAIGIVSAFILPTLFASSLAGRFGWLRRRTIR